jgi:transmembrane sensor
MVRKPATDLEAEAARWFVRWNDATEAAGAKEQSRWFGWLRRSPRHVAAYFAMDDLWARLAESKVLQDFDVESWMSERRAKVVSLHETSVARDASPRPVARRPAWILWAAAGSVAGIAVGALAFWMLAAPGNSYHTGVGEQKIVRLADGSVLQLNTQSQARVAYTDGMREIELKGEALFTVAKEVRRPFLVRTHDATVRALGTRFNVYEQGVGTRVAVLEGRVRVSAASPGSPFDLSAGEEAEVTQRAAHKAIRPNVKVATAWRDRTLVFERATLSDVAREFNRYNTTQIEIDPATGEANRLSGTFDARHPESLLLWLQSRSDLAVDRRGNSYLVRDSSRKERK